MRPILMCCLGTLTLLLGHIPPATASAAVRLQKCVGAICIGQRALTYEQIKTQFKVEKVKARLGFDSKRSLCTYDGEANISAVLSFSGDQPLQSSHVDSIFLAPGMLCQRVPKNQDTHKRLRTENGLEVGQPKERVLELLGNPSRTDDAIARENEDPRYRVSEYGSMYGAIRLHYEEGPHSLLFNQVGVNPDGKIVSIWLSDSE